MVLPTMEVLSVNFCRTHFSESSLFLCPGKCSRKARPDLIDNSRSWGPELFNHIPTCSLLEGITPLLNMIPVHDQRLDVDYIL